MKSLSTLVQLTTIAWAIGATASGAAPLRIENHPATETIQVFRGAADEPLLTQHARENFRPYLHPIVAPDGKGLLTEYSPGHHKHQTGLYWGFTRLNGRDYFHHPGATHWRRVSATVRPKRTDGAVGWQTVHELLDEAGAAVLTETQTWTLREDDGEYVLDLVWRGEAEVGVTIAEYDYGGLFLRMPWRPGMPGQVVNVARQQDQRAEGQRAPWLDVGLQVEGRDDLAHIALFDHPENDGYPLPWRVDTQLGVGPARARLGDWHIKKGETSVRGSAGKVRGHGTLRYLDRTSSLPEDVRWLPPSFRVGRTDRSRADRRQPRRHELSTRKHSDSQRGHPRRLPHVAGSHYRRPPLLGHPRWRE